jgi:hypothetical protein
MSKSQNTNVDSLPTIARLRVQSMAKKCYGRCGACAFTGCFAHEKCAEIASEEGK